MTVKNISKDDEGMVPDASTPSQGRVQGRVQGKTTETKRTAF